MLGSNIVKLSLAGYLKDGSIAPIDKLQNIEWIVEDDTIGRVENNKFIPLSDGRTTLTARVILLDGTYVSNTVDIHVGDLTLDRLELYDIVVTNKVAFRLIGIMNDGSRIDQDELLSKLTLISDNNIISVVNKELIVNGIGVSNITFTVDGISISKNIIVN